MDTSQFQTKAYFVAHSNKNIIEFKDFCVLLHSQAGCTKEERDLGNFTNLLSTVLDIPDKTIKERANFFMSHCKMFEKHFLSLFHISQDKEYCLNFLQLLNEKKMQETAVQIEKIIEMHNTEKKIRFLICLNHFHDKVCVKSSCKISDFLAICNIIWCLI